MDFLARFPTILAVLSYFCASLFHAECHFFLSRKFVQIVSKFFDDFPAIFFRLQDSTWAGPWDLCHKYYSVVLLWALLNVLFIVVLGFWMARKGIMIKL